MSLREPAWRVTTRELEGSLEEERSEGERVASYVLSPFGARMNRVALAGTLSAAEPLGAAEPPTLWRARLADPLGTVAVTAGSFQPRAMVQLRNAPVGRPALVIGKVHLYRGRDDAAIVSVRAEAVRPVPEAEERTMLAEIVRQTLDRLDLLERLVHEPNASEADLRAAGYPSAWVRAARASLRRYPDADRAGYRASLRAVVQKVGGVVRAPPSANPPVMIKVDRSGTTPAGTTARERADEAAFLDLVDEAAEGSLDGYVDVRELLRRLADRGVPGDRAEAVLGRLEEGGVLEEPIVGKLRRA